MAQRRLHFCQPHFEQEHTKKKTYRRKNFRTKANFEDDNDDNSSVNNNNSFFSGVKYIHSLQENADTFVKHVQSYRITRVVDVDDDQKHREEKNLRTTTRRRRRRSKNDIEIEDMMIEDDNDGEEKLHPRVRANVRNGSRNERLGFHGNSAERCAARVVDDGESVGARVVGRRDGCAIGRKRYGYISNVRIPSFEKRTETRFKRNCSPSD